MANFASKLLSVKKEIFAVLAHILLALLLLMDQLVQQDYMLVRIAKDL
jgi:hypothetical protein